MSPPEESPTVSHDPAFDATAEPPPEHASTAPAMIAPMTGAVEIPGYEILEELGRGAMGVVYKARQLALNRTVALKMILSGEHATPRDLVRFLAEAEAVAAIAHPNVVQVFEVGNHIGRPFMALEYCDGGTLTQFLKTRGKLPPLEAAAIVEQIARGVAAAHDQGIVHRDLKPGNVLLTESGRLKVTDFGLAKRDSGHDLTHSDAVLGTPSYMAPEQAKGESKFAGPAVDVWALGVMLYECATGQRPFRAEDHWGLLQAVLTTEPPRPRKLDPAIPKDLEAICLRCLEKEPHERYASAAKMADDLRHFINGEPVSVSSAGASTRAIKWAKRNPSRATAYALTASVLILAAFGVSLAVLLGQAVTSRDRLGLEKTATEKARAAEKKARETAEAAQKTALTAQKETEEARIALALEKEKLERVEYGRTMQVAHQEWRDSNVAATLALLNSTRKDLRGWEWHYVHRICHVDLFTFKGHTNLVNSASFSADGSRVLTGSEDKLAKVWDSKTGAEVLTLRGHTGSVNSASFNPDGSRVLTGSEDNTAKVWDAKTGAEVLTLRGHTFPIFSASFSPDGSRVLTGSYDQTAKVWDVTTGVELLTLKGHTGLVLSASFRADGSRVVTGSGDQTAKVWDATTGAEVLTLRGHTSSVNSASFRADGSRIMTGSEDNTAKVWVATTGAEVLTLKGHTDTVSSTSFRADGSQVVTGSYDNTAKVWDATTGAEVLTLKGHTGPVLSASFSADGSRLVTGSYDKTAKVWDAKTGAELLTLNGHTDFVISASFSADGSRLVTGSEDNTAKVWDAKTGAEVLTLKGHTSFVRSASFSADGARMVTGSEDNTAKVWNATTGAEVLTLKGHTGPVLSASFSTDDSRVVTGSRDQTAKVWDARTAAELLTLKGHTSFVRSASFSTDGSRLVTGSTDKTAKLWDATTGAEVLTLKGHTSFVFSASFSADGSRVVTGSDDKTAKIWDSSLFNLEFLPKELAPLPRQR